MTDTEFGTLVGDVARTAARFAQIEAGSFQRADPALPTAADERRRVMDPK
jgi:hypothetical protein